MSRINNKHYCIFLEQEHTLHTNEELENMTRMIKDRGYYPVILEKDQIKELEENEQKRGELFTRQTLVTIEYWIEWAEEKLKKTKIPCYVCPGNDDVFKIDDLIGSSACIELVEGKIIDLPLDYQMLSTGWSNPTPWKTYRECSEEEMARRLEEPLSKLDSNRPAVFNIHVPPFGIGLDEAPELDENLRPKFAGRSLVPVGSKTVRQVIEKYEPLLGLFGHIHEAKGAVRHKKTLCINPGSNYEQGILLGALINLEKDGLGEYILTSG